MTQDKQQQTLVEYAVDLVLCIDGTYSMKEFIGKVKSNALVFYDKLQEKMKEKDRHIDQLRVKVIVFRDYWGDAPEDVMVCSEFFHQPAQTEQFAAFIQNIQAFGGGEIPENSLEALALAMQSPWDANHKKSRHSIVLFTDAAPHPLEKPNKPAHYPKNIPSDFDALTDFWFKDMNDSVKRLTIIAPDIEPWSSFPDCFDNTILVASPEGYGLDDKTFDAVLEDIANSLP